MLFLLNVVFIDLIELKGTGVIMALWLAIDMIIGDLLYPCLEFWVSGLLRFSYDYKELQ